MRNALVDLVPEVGAEDEAVRTHGIPDIEDDWFDAPYRVPGSDVWVPVHCDGGGMSSCRLEASAVDRVLYDLVNDAARLAADRAVGGPFFPNPLRGSVSW